MTYHLDSNVVIDIFNERFPALEERFRAVSPEEIAISSIAVSELRYGADKSQHKRRNHARLDRLLTDLVCLPFDEKAAAFTGRIRAELEAIGKPIGAYDVQIAAHALSLDAVLVTDNLREFRRVRGLKIENWRHG